MRHSLLATLVLLLFTAPHLQAQKVRPGFAQSLIVDVRTPKEFEHGAATGAINIPLGTIKNNYQRLQGQRQVVVYCHSGIRAMFAAGMLRRHGIKPVVNAGNKNIVMRRLRKEAAARQ